MIIVGNIYAGLSGGGGGTVTGAESGTNLNADGKVRLGNNPLLEDALIDVAGFGITMFGTNAVMQLSDLSVQVAVGSSSVSTVGFLFNFGALPTATYGTQIFGSPEKASADSSINPIALTPFFTLGYTNPTGFFNGFRFNDENFPDFPVTYQEDFNFRSFGGNLVYDASNLIGGLDERTYVQAGKHPVFAESVGIVNVQNQTANRLDGITVNATEDCFVRVSVHFFNNQLPVGSPSLNLKYTDKASNLQSISLGAFPNIGPQTINDITFYAQKNTVVALEVLISVSANYDIFAQLEYMNIKNP